MMARRFAAELLGTALLVFFGAGVATLVFGFRIFGASLAAGLIAVALAFGLIYAGLVYLIGPISGGHINPAVSLGAYLSNRLSLIELGSYWAAQLIGSVLGTLVLWWVLATSPYYDRSRIGLGANGYGGNSLLRIGAGGAFLIEVLLTAVFVLVVLSLTREGGTLAVAGAGIGIALAVANLIGIPFDGASVNPARSFGPALISGGSVLSQLWLFLIAPLVGAILATGVHLLLYPVPGGLQGAMDHALGRRPAQAGLQPAGDGYGGGAQPGTGAPVGSGFGGTPAGPETGTPAGQFGKAGEPGMTGPPESGPGERETGSTRGGATPGGPRRRFLIPGRVPLRAESPGHQAWAGPSLHA
jgi:aquaporin Z